MAMHEVGFLILGGVFQCWFWQGAENSCPSSEKISPAGIQRASSSQYLTKEVYYEESGFVVFDKKGDTFQIQKNTGEKVWLNLNEINQQINTALPKTISAVDKENSRWRYVSIDDVLKNGMLDKITDGPLDLYQDDLKTPVALVNSTLKRMKEERDERILKDRGLQLAVGYIVTSTTCTHTTVGKQTQGSCAPPAKAPAYSKPDRQATKILDASFNFGHFKGLPKLDTATSPTHSEKLFVYEEKADWFRMRLEVFDETKRDVWVHKKDIPYPYTRLAESERLSALKELVNSRGGSVNFEEIESELGADVRLEIESAAATKWDNGTLWVKINVRDKGVCSGEDHKVLATGWVPYINPKTKKKNIGWFSRGC